MDATKQHPKLSYLSNWRFSFPASVISLEYFHLNNQVLILWTTMVVTRDPAVGSASEEKVETQNKINPH